MQIEQIYKYLEEFSISRVGTAPTELVLWYITKQVQLELYANVFTLIVNGVKIPDIKHDKVVYTVQHTIQQLYRDALLEVEYNSVAIQKLKKFKLDKWKSDHGRK